MVEGCCFEEVRKIFMSIDLMEKKLRIRWQLMFYDIVIYLCVVAFMISLYGTRMKSASELLITIVATLFCLLFCRVVGKV